MPKKNTESQKSGNMNVRNIHHVGGDVNIAKGDITTHRDTGLSREEIGKLFDQVYFTIESRLDTSAITKQDLKADLQEVQAVVTEAAQKNQEIDESFLRRQFRNIARMAPDILDVIVATLASPLGGLGEVLRKLASKAKEETQQG